MKITAKNIKKLLALIYLVFTYLGDVEAYKEVAPKTMAATLLLLIAVYVFEVGFKFKIKPNLYEVWMLVFAGFCMMSSRWAYFSNDAVAMSKNIIEMAVATVIVSVCTKDTFKMDDYLDIIMACGYILVTSLIFFYGISTIGSLLTGNVRLNNDYMNANTIGMCAAYSVLVNAFYLKMRIFKWWTIFLLPAVAIIFVSESKKVLIILFLGAILLYFTGNRKKEERIKLYKLLAVMAGVFLLFMAIIKLPMFQFIYVRILSFMDVIINEGTGDWSTQLRIQMIKTGLSYFRQHPFVGIGIDNVGRFVAQGIKYTTKASVYTHNNYVELLAGLGIIGSLLYYSMYFYILVNLLKNWRKGDNDITMMLLFTICRLVLDFAAVSYSVKFTYFMGMVSYTIVLRLKTQKMESEKLTYIIE